MYCSKTAVLKRLRQLLPHYGNQSRNNKVTNEIPRPQYSREYRYLRKINTDQIFIWTKVLALRSDMQEIRWTGKRFLEVTRLCGQKPYKTSYSNDESSRMK
jgi:hypothetical protein